MTFRFEIAASSILRSSLLLLLCVCFTSKSGIAQPSQTFTFSDGTTATCKTYAGKIAQQVSLPALAGTFMNMGYTGLTIALPDGSARITWDTTKLNSYPPEAHDFIYFHECAHAHVPTSDELMANCVGLIDMRAAGRSSPAIEEKLRQFHVALGFMGPRYGVGADYWAKTVQCAGSGGPAVQLKPAASTTLTCSFTSGPQAGRVVDFSNQAGAVPAMVGSQCSDGAGSFGMAVPPATAVSSSLGSTGLQGDWKGTLATPGGNLPLVFHLSASGVGTADSPSQNAFGMPLLYSLNATKPTISIPSVGASYAPTVNGNQMSGTFSQNGGSLQLTLTKDSPGTSSTPATTNGVQGDWQGTLATPGGSLPLVFHFGNGGNGTADDLAHSVNGIPLQYTVNANQVNLSMPSVGATYTATVNGNQMSGTFSQSGGNFQLTLTKGSTGPSPAPAPAPASGIQGDWQGTLATPGGSLPLVFHLGNGGSGTADDLAHSVNGIPLQYAVNANQVNLSMPSVGATYTATVNGNQMSGTFSQSGGNFQLTLTKGSAGSSPAPAPAPANGIQGNWQGTLATPGGSFPLVFHLGNGGSGTTDDIAHSVNGIPLQYAISGNQINISIPSVGATYTATVNGNQMSGIFSQGGGSLQLTLTKH
jgi:hypothetical protein